MSIIHGTHGTENPADRGGAGAFNPAKLIGRQRPQSSGDHYGSTIRYIYHNRYVKYLNDGRADFCKQNQ